MEDNVGHHGSPEGQSLLGKAKSLSDCFGTLTDANVGLEKRVHKSDHEIDNCKAEKLQREGIGQFSATVCTKGNVDNLKRSSSVISTVRNSVLKGEIYAEGTSTVMSCRNGSDNNEDSGVSTPFLQGNTSVKKSSMKSDVCSDSGQPFEKEINELADGKMDGYPGNMDENELKSPVQTTFHDKQFKSESSSSNSTQVILPASSNDSCQEMSVDKKSCQNIKLRAIDTSTCTDYNLEEPAFRSLVPGMAIHASKYELDTTTLSSENQYNLIKAAGPVDNVRKKGSDKVLGVTSDDNCGTVENFDHLKSEQHKKKMAELYNQDRSENHYDLDDALEVARRVANEVEQEVEASGSSSSIQGRNSEMVHLSSVDSADSDREGCLTETGSIVHQCNEQVKSDSFCSTKEAVDLKLLTKKEQLCLEVKEPLQGMVAGINEGCQRQQPSNITIKPEGVAADDQTTHHFCIDLNEDILENEVEYPDKSVKETVPNLEIVSKPIPVVAKSGIPLCLPVPQFQNEGELGGWRGSAATSAFRPTSFSEGCSRNKALSTNDTIGSSNYSHVVGIDLNIAAAGVDFEVELLPKKFIPELSSHRSKESSVEVSSRQARTFDFDLNSVSENDNNSHQLSPPASLSSHSVRDFDLNDNPTSAVACNGPYQPREGTQGLRNGTSDDPAVSSVENLRQSDCRSFRSSCSLDLSSMDGFSHSHAKPFLVAAANMLPSNEQMQRIAGLQHKVTFTQPPPHAFLYSNGFCIDPNNSISSTGYPPSVMPYVADPRAATVIPQILGSGTLSLFSGAPHLMEVPRGSGPSDIAFIRPTFDLNSGANSVENGSRGANARQLCFPVSDSTMEEQMKSYQQVALTATPLKRREPDGGWDSHQLFFRQATSWR